LTRAWNVHQRVTRSVFVRLRLRREFEWNHAAPSRAGIVNNNPVLVRDVLGEALV